MKLIFSGILIILLSSQNLLAQDSLAVKKDSIDSVFIAHLPFDKAYQFNYKKLIIPTVFISYGVATLKIDKLKQLNFSTRNEINEHKPDHIRLDNYT